MESAISKSDHAFILPMHEYGTGDRYRNRKASRERFTLGTTPQRGWTGKLPARHPFQSAIDSYMAGATLSRAVVQSIERAFAKAEKGAAK